VYPYAFAPLFYDLARWNGSIMSSSDPLDEDAESGGNGSVERSETGNGSADRNDAERGEATNEIRRGTGIESASIIRQLLMVIHPKMVPKIIPKDYAQLILSPDPKVALLKKFSPESARKFTDNRMDEHLWYSVLPIVDVGTYDIAIDTIRSKHSRDTLPNYMIAKNQPFVRKVDRESGQETIVKSLPKLKAEDSKYQWTGRMLM